MGSMLPYLAYMDPMGTGDDDSGNNEYQRNNVVISLFASSFKGTPFFFWVGTNGFVGILFSDNP